MLSRRRVPARPSSPISWALGALAALLVGALGVHQQILHQGRHPLRTKAKQDTVARLKSPATVTLPATSVPETLPFPIGENSGILWNLSTGQLLWADHPHLREPYASTTKLMTIYLVMQHLPLTRVVTISPAAAGTSGSDIFMAVGDRFTVRQLLYALMLRSANDAAIALAQAEAGTVGRFVDQMNAMAKTLGMRQTTYRDPDGLSPQSAGTAWDLSIIARLDMESPLFRQIVRTKETSLPYNPVVTNLNGLLFLDPTVIGIKSGWTTAAGFNLVFAATRPVDGHPVTLMGVLMHGQLGFPPEYQDAERLLNWGFQRVKASDSGLRAGP
ncbi:MAG: serine hydrolase [Firmicutes bacterium]|nr:serine hydrolase [Bacillota bacterium]